MSMRATTWALYEAPTDLDGNEFRILMLLADAAHDDGTCAFKSAKRLAFEAGISKRTVMYKLKALEQQGLIRRGDQKVVGHLPANYRPTVYDLCMEQDTDSAPLANEGRSAGRHADSAPLANEGRSAGRHADSAPLDGAGVQTGVQKNSDRGANRGADCLHINQNKEEPTTNQRESRARENSQSALAGFQPDDQHRALATVLNLDLEAELDKFCDSCLANGKTPRDIPAAFRNWLRRGHELGITRAQAHVDVPERHVTVPHRHSPGCEHVEMLIGPYRSMLSSENTSGFGTSPLYKARAALAESLNHGLSGPEALKALRLPADELEAIA